MSDRLHSSDVDLRWLLAMSPRFLVGRVKSDKRRIHVWDRENGYVKLPMDDAPRLKEFSLVSHSSMIKIIFYT